MSRAHTEQYPSVCLSCCRSMPLTILAFTFFALLVSLSLRTCEIIFYVKFYFCCRFWVSYQTKYWMFSLWFTFNCTSASRSKSTISWAKRERPEEILSCCSQWDNRIDDKYLPFAHNSWNETSFLRPNMENLFAHGLASVGGHVIHSNWNFLFTFVEMKKKFCVEFICACAWKFTRRFNCFHLLQPLVVYRTFLSTIDERLLAQCIHIQGACINRWEACSVSSEVYTLRLKEKMSATMSLTRLRKMNLWL